MEIKFKDNNEKVLYEKYKKLKGEEYHFYVAEQIDSYEYSHIAAAIQYDLKLKYILYKYICFFEESLRAVLMNTQVRSVEDFLQNTVNLSETQQLYFQYKTIILAHDKHFTNLTVEEFGCIRDLRNQISHFKPLIFEKFNTSKQSMMILGKALPNEYKNNYINHVNSCKPDYEILNELLIRL